MAEIMAEFGGMSQFVQPGDRVLVKPNMLEGADKNSGITTHPWGAWSFQFKDPDSNILNFRGFQKEEKP